MSSIALTSRERGERERVSRPTQDAGQLRRTNAIPALGKAQESSAAARAQRVDHFTRYESVARFEGHRNRDLEAATTTLTTPV